MFSIQSSKRSQQIVMLLSSLGRTTSKNSSRRGICRVHSTGRAQGDRLMMMMMMMMMKLMMMTLVRVATPVIFTDIIVSLIMPTAEVIANGDDTPRTLSSIGQHDPKTSRFTLGFWLRLSQDYSLTNRTFESVHRLPGRAVLASLGLWVWGLGKDWALMCFR